MGKGPSSALILTKGDRKELGYPLPQTCGEKWCWNSRWRQHLRPGLLRRARVGLGEWLGWLWPVDGAVCDLQQAITFHVTQKNPGRTDLIFHMCDFICLGDV